MVISIGHQGVREQAMFSFLSSEVEGGVGFPH